MPKDGLGLKGGTDEPRERPILLLDFDGVLHSYKSGWQGVDVIPDPPVPGFDRFLAYAIELFDVCVYNSRSKNIDGRRTMEAWLRRHLAAARGIAPALEILQKVWFSTDKPAAFLTLDDRAVTFTGTWPDPAELRRFEPWWKS
jgi:hypothetical protein